jgi:arginine:pyruvate transaminase
MKFAPFVDRITGKGASAWDLHNRAWADIRTNPDVIALSIGDPEFDTPAPIIDTAVNRLRGGDTHYTAVSGRDALKDAIARDHERLSGRKVGRDNIIVLAGAQNALLSTSMCIAGPGDEAITFDPMYATYEATIQASGATMVTVNLDQANNFRLDPDALKRAITPRTRAIYVTNPHNPTGVVFTREELQIIANLAVKNDLWIVADEVYADLIFDGQHTAMASLDGIAERTVTISSLSKSRNMPGWRVGWTIGPKDLIAHQANLALCMLYGLPGFIQDAAVTALNECADEPARLTAVYRERRDYTVSHLNQIPGITCAAPQAGMFVMADVRATGLTSNDFCWGLYNETKVAVLDADGLGHNGNGYFRLAYTTSEHKLAEACRRIASYVNGL